VITIVPTIDVEGVHGDDPVGQFIHGSVADGDWGVYRLAQAFNEFGCSATFFVDCYEYTLWGEARLEEVCCRLLEAGQDVQLHTHPAWRDDFHDHLWLRRLKRDKGFMPQQFDFMSRLSMADQLEVIQRGCEMIEKWTGKRPVAHRSGGYSINCDTVSALVQAGIKLDSSMNVAHSNSQVRWATNRVVKMHGLLELPVTVLSYEFAPLGTRSSTCYSKLMKTDLDSCTIRDFKAYLEQAVELDLKVMNLFMHSYSLLKFDLFYRSIRPEPSDLAKLRKLLEIASASRSVQVMSCAEFLSAYEANPETFSGGDGVPRVRNNTRIAAFGMRKGVNAARDVLGRRLRPKLTPGL